MVILFLSLTITIASFSKPITIMLSSVHNAHNIGHIIDNSFEHGIALYYVENLKKLIEKTISQNRLYNQQVNEKK